jgi:SAM-dependent methyltransferase
MNQEELINRIRSIKVLGVLDEDAIRRAFVTRLTGAEKVMDCGKSLRTYWEEAKQKSDEILTVDINRFKDYPDILADICDPTSLRDFENYFDYVACFSLLEHTHNPFLACNTLFSICKPGGYIIGSAPFLFPRHSPEDLSYQDFFRFTRDAYALLFPTAKSIILHPLRGRLATALNVMSLKYRFNFEKSFPGISSKVSKVFSHGRNALNSSGYGFIIQK